MRPTRLSISPDFSSGTNVFANVGAALLLAIASISFRFSAIACSSAGLKSATFTLSNGGTPPYGPVHFSVSGLTAAGSASFAAAADWVLVVVIQKAAAPTTASPQRYF